MSDAVFIGRLVTTTQFLAELAPIAELVNGRWVKIKDATSRFPKKGRVRADPDQLGSVKQKASLWVFRCVPPSDGQLAWQAATPERARPVVDLTYLSIEDARRVLLEQGVALPDGQTRRAVVILAGNLCCEGIFEPKETNKQKWLLKLPPDGCVELFDFDPVLRESDQVIGGVFWPVIGKGSDLIRSRVDWSSDRDVVQRFIERYGRAVRAYVAHVEKSQDPALKRLERLLVESRIGGQGAGDFDAIAQRLRGDWTLIDRDLIGLEELSDLLLESAPGKALLDSAVLKRTSELEVQLETALRLQLDSELKGVRAELLEQKASAEKEALRQVTLARENDVIEARKGELLQSLHKQEQSSIEADESIRRATTELEQLRDEAQQLAARRRALEDELHTLGEGLKLSRAAVEEFVSRARDVLAAGALDDWDTSQILARRLEALLETTGDVPRLLPSLSCPWSTEAIAEPQSIEIGELQPRLEAEALAHGVATDDVILLDGIGRAGELVLLFGSQAEFALTAYTRVVSAGRLCVSALDPSVIGLDDLWRTPVSHRPTPFAMAWHEAETHPEQLVVAVLRNLDSAPFRSWIGSFVAALASSRRPRNLVVLATTGGGYPDGDDDPEINDLRHWLVALRPRATTNSASSEVVLGGRRAPVSLLQLPRSTGDGLTHEVFRLLTSKAQSAATSRRALAVRAALQWAAAERATEWSLHLSKYWADGQPDALPEALAAGHRALATLNQQR